MLIVSESFINATEGFIFGDSPPYETYFETVGELFQFCQKEYGGCVSTAYVDKEDGGIQKVGWVFQRTERYEDARHDWPKEKAEYLREVWVTVHEQMPERHTTYHYANL